MLDKIPGGNNLQIPNTEEALDLDLISNQLEMSINRLELPTMKLTLEKSRSANQGQEILAKDKADDMNWSGIMKPKSILLETPQNNKKSKFASALKQSMKSKQPSDFKSQKSKTSRKTGNFLESANKKILAKLMRSRIHVQQSHTIDQQTLKNSKKVLGTFECHGEKLYVMCKLYSDLINYSMTKDHSLFSVHLIQLGKVLYGSSSQSKQQFELYHNVFRAFESFVILLILANSVVIAMYDQMDKSSQYQYNQTLDFIQWALTLIFTFEAFLRIIGMGFILHEKAYMRDPWNWLDLFTVIAGWLELIPGLPRLKYFRTLRILRPLRSIKAVPGLRRLIQSLLQSMKLLANVITFLLIFVFFFGIVGVAIFKGKDYNRCHLTEFPQNNEWQIDSDQPRICSMDGGMYRCNPGTYCGNPEQYHLPLKNYKDSLNLYGMNSFDNLLESLSTIFQVITLEGWVKIMYNMSDAGTNYQGPLYFMFIVVFGSFFMMNLILAVIMDSFEKVDKQMALEELKKEFRDVELRVQKTMLNGGQVDKEDDSFYTEEINNSFEKQSEQLENISPEVAKRDELPKQWAEIPKLEDSILQLPNENEEINNDSKLERKKTIIDQILDEDNVTYNDDQLVEILERSNKNYLFNYAYKLANHRGFTAFILLVIIANTIVLFMDRHPMPQDLQNDLEQANSAFLAIFIVEMLIKLVAFGPKNYCRDNFNIFDVVVIVFSLADSILSEGNSDQLQKSLLAFRALRFLRIFKLARQWQSFQIILKKMSSSFKDMLYFLILLLIFIFVYALLGMELYSNSIKFTDDSPIPCGTSDNEDISLCIGQSPRLNFDKFENAIMSVFILIVGDDWNSYQADYVRATSRGSIAYFTSITIFGNIVLLNLFLAILLRQFEDKTFESDGEDSEYKKLWNTVQAKSTIFTFSVKTWWQKKFGFFFTQKRIMDEQSSENLVASAFVEDFERAHSSQQNSDKVNNKLLLNKTEIVRQAQINEIFDIHENEEVDIRKINTLKFANDIKASEYVLESGRNLIGFNRQGQSFTNDNSKELQQVSPVKTKEYKISKLKEDDSIPGLSIQAQGRLESSRNKSKSGTNVNIFKSTYQEKSMISFIYNLEGQALFIFSPRNWVRIVSTSIVQNKVFKGIILILVVLTTVNLALNEPLSDPNSDFNMILYYIDLGFSITFAVECLLKIISRGFIFNGKGSYLRNAWSRMDFIIVIISLVSFASTSDLKVSKLLRNLRVIRPLRMIPKNEGLKIAVQSLVNSIKGIINVTVIALFIFFVWGIFGVNFFKGLYYVCYQDHLEGTSVEIESLIIDSKWDCFNTGGEWLKRKNTFDNVFYAAFTLFQISTTEGWVGIMNQVIDAREIDFVTKQDSNKWSSLYFVAFIFVGGLFTLNLFQGVVISTYLNEKEKLSNNHVLTDMQKEWIQVQIKCYKTKPSVKSPKGAGRIRRMLIKFTTSLPFELFIYFSILVNTIILACNWYGMPPSLEQVLSTINNFFTIIFCIEAILKISGLGCLYFKKPWNLFDFAILLSTIIQTTNSITKFGAEMTLYTTILRVLKLLKATRMFKKASAFKNILKTLIVTIPSLANIALLLFILIVFYAITGMNVFGRVMFNNSLDAQVNFQNFPQAFMTMMRCATGEAWNDIMTSLMEQKSITFQCIDYPSYEDIVRNNGQGVACGSYWPSMIFFLSYQMLVCQIFLNLFIAIILDGFDDSKQDQALRIDDQMLKRFKDAWVQYDQEGTGFIKIDDLEDLIDTLIINRTDWIRGGDILLTSQKQLRNFVTLLELPMYNCFRNFYFYDVLSRLAQAVFKVDFERFILDQQAHEQSLLQDDKTPEDNEQHMLKWMQQKDHLLFESFDDFYQDLFFKLHGGATGRNKIALNEDLKNVTLSKEKGLENIRSRFDSRILTVVPVLIRQMRKLAQAMRKKRWQQKDENLVKLEVLREFEDVKRFNINDEVLAAKLKKKREDFFQILAKSFVEEALAIRNKKSNSVKIVGDFSNINKRRQEGNIKAGKSFTFGGKAKQKKFPSIKEVVNDDFHDSNSRKAEITHLPILLNNGELSNLSNENLKDKELSSEVFKNGSNARNDQKRSRMPDIIGTEKSITQQYEELLNDNKSIDQTL